VPEHRPPTRRELLAAAAAVAVAASPAGCATWAPDTSSRSSTTATTDDSVIARDAARTAGELLAAYRATTRRHPDLRRTLEPLAAHHAEHLAVLATDDLQPVRRRPRVPRARSAALASLQRRERAAAGSRRTALVAASSGDLARVLAAVVACQAQHLVLLDEGSE